MAVRVVNPEPDPKVIRHVTCNECGSRLEFLPIDIQKKNYRDISGTADTHCWIDCPNCRNAITVSEYGRR